MYTYTSGNSGSVTEGNAQTVNKCCRPT